MIRFVNVKPDEETNDAFTTKEVAFPNGIYNDIQLMSLLMRLIPRINLPNRIFMINRYFYFKQKASDSKVLISINCDEKCKMLHHINFFDNLLMYEC